MQRVFAYALIFAAAFAQTPAAPISGKVEAAKGEKPILFLSFRDQKAVNAGRATKPVQVPVGKDGTFAFPPALPDGYTIATTPACIDITALYLTGDSTGIAPTSRPATLGTEQSMTTRSFNLLDIFKSNATTQSTFKGTSTNIGGGVGLGGTGLTSASANFSKKIGGVNIGCRTEKERTGNAQ